MPKLPFTITNDSITVIHNGKSHVVQSGSPHFNGLRKAISEERWDDVPKHLTVSKSFKTWAFGKFTIDGDTVSFNGEEIPKNINRRVLEMHTANEDPRPLFRFWERLQKNPSFRSVAQLFDFLRHENIPIMKDGRFLAYKGVKGDYKDVYSGTFDNSPGKVHRMARNKISDDPNKACHDGFHVGSLNYAKKFHSGGKLVVCIVDPEHVVCVPYDHSQEKMRVCEYRVLGNYGSALPSTTFEDELTNEVVDMEGPEDSHDGPYDEDAQPAKVEEAKSAKPKKDKKKKGKGKREKVKPLPTMDKALRAKFDHADMKMLMEMSIEDLRQYAFKGLSIVGASKIPGGKTTLVARIIEVRKKASKEK